MSRNDPSLIRWGFLWPSNIIAILTCFVLFVIVNAPNLALTAVSYDFLTALATTLAPALLMGFGLFALAPRLTLSLFCLLTPVSLLETFYVLRYEHASDEHILAILSETNIQEAMNWLGADGILAIACSFLASLMGLLLIRLNHQLSKIFVKRWRYIMVAVGFISFGLMQVADFGGFRTHNTEINAPTNHAHAANTSQDISAQLTGSFERSALFDTFPWGLPLRIDRYSELRSGFENARHALEKFRFGATQLSEHADVDQVVVLVIGETGRPDRWQINGYHRATNPRLSHQEGLVSFTNATTGWSWTRMSVPVILSRKPSQLSTTFFPERSIISAFREAGFWTAWYSMHGALGFHESAVALYASEAHDVRYLNSAGYRSPGEYDGVLLPALEKALSRPEGKKFIVLHTMGSHFNYAHRTPPEFDIFHPSLRERRDSDLHDRSQREELNNSYDNSILYTDHILAEVIRRLNATGKNTALLYVADHGENLFDDQCDKAGHGHNTKYDYRIAALWWNSQYFKNIYPEKTARISSRREASWSTEAVFSTLLDAADITISSPLNTNKSLFGSGELSYQRWIQSGGYFDSALPDGSCRILKPNKSSS